MTINEALNQLAASGKLTDRERLAFKNKPVSMGRDWKVKILKREGYNVQIITVVTAPE